MQNFLIDETRFWTNYAKKGMEFLAIRDLCPFYGKTAKEQQRRTQRIQFR